MRKSEYSTQFLPCKCISDFIQPPDRFFAVRRECKNSRPNFIVQLAENERRRKALFIGFEKRVSNSFEREPEIDSDSQLFLIEKLVNSSDFFIHILLIIIHTKLILLFSFHELDLVRNFGICLEFDFFLKPPLFHQDFK